MRARDKKYSQLVAMAAVIKASLKGIIRSPSTVVFSLVFPLIFILVFGFISGGSFTLTIAVNPASLDSNNMVYQIVSKSPGVKIVSYTNLDKLNKDLTTGKVDAWMKIGTSKGRQKFDIKLITSTASPEEGRIIRSLVDGIADKASLASANVNEPAFDVSQDEVKGRKYRKIDFILPGQLGFSLLSTGVFATAFVFFNLRQTLVLKRYFATPIKRIYIILGESIARLIFNTIGSLIIILIGYYAFDFTLLHGAITVINLLTLSALALIVFMGFGFVISGIAKQDSTIPPLANIITLPQFLLAGTFFPISNFPSWLQPISNVLPLTYLNSAMRKVAFDGANLIDVAPQIGVLLLWGVLVYGLSIKTFRWE